MDDKPTPQEITHNVREWAGEEVRRLFRESKLVQLDQLATITCAWESAGPGWPQTVGEFSEPVQPSIVPQRYELTLLLPPDAQSLAEGLGDELRKAAEQDQTLGERVMDAEIPSGVFEPEDGENENFEGSIRLRIPVTVYCPT
jgi:hypothetical protein